MPDCSQLIFHETVVPSTLTSVYVQPPRLSPLFGIRFSAFSACSFVTQTVIVWGGIFIGMLGISIWIVLSHLPAFAIDAAITGSASEQTIADRTILRSFIGESSVGLVDERRIIRQSLRTTRLRVDGSTRSAPVSAADSLPLFTITTTEPAGVAAS